MVNMIDMRDFCRASGIRCRMATEQNLCVGNRIRLISCAANLVQIGPSRSDIQAEPTNLGGEG